MCGIKATAVAVLIVTAWNPPAFGQPGPRPRRARVAERYVLPVRRTFEVDRAERQALVFAPREALASPAAIVFAFHGHGGTMQKSAEMFGYHEAWREAIVVYPQGLNTPSASDPEGREPGWMIQDPAEQNRDLKFFDAMLAALDREFEVDRRRIYASGTSNGGFFTYAIWAARPDTLAAIAPAAATARGALRNGKPIPVFHVGGERDDKVSIELQRATIDGLRTLNGCGEGRPGRRATTTIYPSSLGAPVVAFIHPGGHGFPGDAVAPIVEFFKRHPRPATE